MIRKTPEIVRCRHAFNRDTLIYLIPPPGPAYDCLVGLDGIVRPPIIRQVKGCSGMLNASGTHELPWVATDHQPLPADQTAPTSFDWPYQSIYFEETAELHAGWVLIKYVPINVHGDRRWAEVLIKDGRGIKAPSRLKLLLSR